MVIDIEFSVPCVGVLPMGIGSQLDFQPAAEVSSCIFWVVVLHGCILILQVFPWQGMPQYCSVMNVRGFQNLDKKTLYKVEVIVLPQIHPTVSVGIWEKMTRPLFSSFGDISVSKIAF